MVMNMYAVSLGRQGELNLHAAVFESILITVVGIKGMVLSKTFY
jgi:hypothetical protein